MKVAVLLNKTGHELVFSYLLYTSSICKLLLRLTFCIIFDYSYWSNINKKVNDENNLETKLKVCCILYHFLFLYLSFYVSCNSSLLSM
jgi:hypothetical protein